MNKLTEKEILDRKFGYGNTDFVVVVDMIRYLSGDVKSPDYNWPDEYEFDYLLHKKILEKLVENRKNGKENKDFIHALVDIFNKYGTLEDKAGFNQPILEGKIPQSVLNKLYYLQNFYYEMDSKFAKEIIEKNNKKTEKVEDDIKKNLKKIDDFLKNKEYKKRLKKENKNSACTKAIPFEEI